MVTRLETWDGRQFEYRPEQVPGTDFHVGDVGPCQGFEGPCEKQGQWQRQHTAYHDDRQNFVCLCDDCAEANAEAWQERWDEYYGGRL